MKNLYKIQDELYIIDNNEKVTQNGIWAKCSFTGDILKNRNGQYAYKVILTTNKLLIKDGVQAIDDEFLEWFVKNPSCEEVEVVDNLKYFNVDELRERHLKGLPHLYSEKIGYKIIIQKEEPKQELPKLGTKEFNDLASAYFGGKPKQETLEEAAEKYAELSYYNRDDVNAFVNGAKWQAERMYSEKELFQIIAEILHTPALRDGSWEDISNWFEQFKKK
jgi:hypothetical protein